MVGSFRIVGDTVSMMGSILLECVLDAGARIYLLHVPFQTNTHNRENTPHNRENISNNIPISIIYPQNGWGKPNTWVSGQPGGQIFQKKVARIYSAGPPGTLFLKV